MRFYFRQMSTYDTVTLARIKQESDDDFPLFLDEIYPADMNGSPILSYSSHAGGIKTEVCEDIDYTVPEVTRVDNRAVSIPEDFICGTTKQESVEECNRRMKQEPQDEYCGSDDCSEPVPNVERRTVEINWGDIHMFKILYKCDQCEKSYTQSSDLTYHIREVHNAWKRYKCDQCGKSFNRNAWLKAHIRTHTGEKPYKCDQCDKSFKSNSWLKEHIRAHTGERPYKCDQCDNSYSTKSNLKVHKRSHTGEKPYKCEQCGKSFSRNRSVQTHKCTHTQNE